MRIAVDPNGDIILAADFDYNTATTAGYPNHYVYKSGGMDIYIVKYGQDGAWYS